MAELGLALVGTRPPSATGSRPSSATGYYYPPSPKTPKPMCNGSAYQDRIFGTTSTHGPPKANSDGQIRNTTSPSKGKPSYVDETLFANQDTSWRAPWHTDKKSKPLLYDGTDYKQAKAMLSGKTHSKKSANMNTTFNARSPSAHKNRNKHTASYVDETLFGPRLEESTFVSPWDPTGGKPPKTVFDATDYKAVAERKAAKAENESKQNSQHTPWRPSSARPGSASASPRPSSRSSARIPKPKHRGSYADELLFGPKLADPSFPAPWEKREKKPDLFSMTDYKAGPSARERRQQESARGDQRPAWR